MAVVMSTGSAPRHDGMRKAALSATPVVVERLDTSGTRSARLFPRSYFIQATGIDLDRLPSYAQWLAPIAAAARTALLYVFPQLMDKRMVETMRRLPAVTAESPIAVERMQLMFRTFSGKPHRVEMIPHPVNEAELFYDGSPKENLIVSVGRWNSYQKDYPMLKKVLKGFLERHPDWRAIVVGGGVPEAESASRGNAEDWRTRITYHDKLEHSDLGKIYNRAKIYVMVSRFESFCIAAAEAICCGCSVVGSCDVPTSPYFAEKQAGRVADPRSAPAFLDCLDAEVDSWAAGERNPKTISSYAKARVGTNAVCEATVALLKSIESHGTK